MSTASLKSTESRPAFTLVELLVVIGIIALLISILLPSLSKAREAAARVKCGATLQQMMVAANLHLIDKKGYYPLAGWIHPGNSPEVLNDSECKHYSYFSFQLGSQNRTLMPITVELGMYMGYKRMLDDTDSQLGEDQSKNGWLARSFLCPSQAATPGEIVQPGATAMPPQMMYMTGDPNTPYFSSEATWYRQGQSYIYNEAILGFYDDTRAGMHRLRGQANKVRQPSRTMFAADGLGGILSRPLPVPPNITGNLPMMTLYNIAPNPPVTMGDAFLRNGKAGDPENFDLLRHQGKLNVAFCDGHVELRAINKGDLSAIYLLAP